MSELSPISARFDPEIDALPAGSKPFRLGLLGGTFDPVHIGHMNIAERALEQFKLDGVLFIPTGRPIRKALAQLSAGDIRCSLLKLAIASNPRFDLSHIELDRKGATYTIDTLRALKERYGDRVQLFFITGADSTVDLPTWKDADKIAQLVEVLSAPRTIAAAETPAMLHTDQSNFIIHEIQAPLIDVASSELRAWVRQGRSLRYLVPDVVCDYIEQQRLYRN